MTGRDDVIRRRTEFDEEDNEKRDDRFSFSSDRFSLR
jgi:hypothetical protein